MNPGTTPTVDHRRYPRPSILLYNFSPLPSPLFPPLPWVTERPEHEQRESGRTPEGGALWDIVRIRKRPSLTRRNQVIHDLSEGGATIEVGGS